MKPSTTSSSASTGTCTTTATSSRQHHHHTHHHHHHHHRPIRFGLLFLGIVGVVFCIVGSNLFSIDLKPTLPTWNDFEFEDISIEENIKFDEYMNNNNNNNNANYLSQIITTHNDNKNNSHSNNNNNNSTTSSSSPNPSKVNAINKQKQKQKQPPTPHVAHNKPQQRVVHVAQHQEQKPIPNFLFHIPKTGGEYALYTLQNILMQWFKKRNQPISYRVCNEGTRPLQLFDKYYHSTYNYINCTIWMSEVQYSPRPVHKYTLLRDRRQHVLSQYFHCSEGKRPQSRKKRIQSTSLNQWLQTWLDINYNTTTTATTTLKGRSTSYNPKKYSYAAKRYKDEIQCYNPTNLQSWYVNFDVTKQTIEDLSQLYTVLGDTSQMQKFICLMFIHYTGEVPRPWCDCTDTTIDGVAVGSNNNNNNNNNNTTLLSNTTTNANNATTTATTTTTMKQQQQQQQRYRRRLEGKQGKNNLKYDPKKHGHGVKHHAATYQTTKWQDEAIANLTRYDQILYNWGRSIFDDQVSEIENKFNIKICDTFREG